MNFKLISLISFLLFLACQSARSENEEYFEKSIIQALKDKKGHFSSEIVYVLYGNTTVHEKYSFNQNSGEHTQISQSYSSMSSRSRTLYLNGSEMHEIREEDNSCRSNKIDKFVIRYTLYSWAPTEVFNRTFNYTFLGPSVLLDILLQTKNKVNCTSLDDETKNNYKKCSIEFNKRIKLDYYFVDQDEYTMIPVKILGYMNHNSRIKKKVPKWKLTAQFHYSSFTPSFSDENVISSNLPIGFGCRRFNSTNYPIIETNYGRKFELDQNVLFNYTYSLTYFYNNRTIKKNHLATKYPNKMYVDLDNAINDAKTVNETTNESIRTVYDMSTHLLNSVYEENDKCLTYNLTSNRTLNWFYVQDTFVKVPDLYYAKDYHYLGETNLGDVPCLVFEKKFDYYYFFKFLNYDEYFASNSTHKKTTRGNKNGLKVEGFVISTHFYPKDKNYWSEKTNHLSVPIKIDIRIVDGRSRADRLIIDTKSFTDDPVDYEKYEADECINMDS